ncbi:MAG: hypothetical protein GQ574_26665 [Crocinitomix sp.]|nr:hypothetical protein [Crocinitomix sp.]
MKIEKLVKIALVVALCFGTIACEKEVFNPKRGLNIDPPPSESESPILNPNGG